MKIRILIIYIIACVCSSCNQNKNSFLPPEASSSTLTNTNKESSTSESVNQTSFSIAYKNTNSGVKTIHVKLNDAASFDAIFDTGCSGMLISLQEAMSLVKSGTLKPEDCLGESKSTIANGEVIENAVFKIHEVSLVDTKGQKHTIYDVPVTVVENPGADILVGNIIIAQLAEYAYTIDLKQHIIIFQ